MQSKKLVMFFQGFSLACGWLAWLFALLLAALSSNFNWILYKYAFENETRQSNIWYGLVKRCRIDFKNTNKTEIFGQEICLTYADTAAELVPLILVGATILLGIVGNVCLLLAMIKNSYRLTRLIGYYMLFCAGITLLFSVIAFALLMGSVSRSDEESGYMEGFIIACCGFVLFFVATVFAGLRSRNKNLRLRLRLRLRLLCFENARLRLRLHLF